MSDPSHSKSPVDLAALRAAGKAVSERLQRVEAMLGKGNPEYLSEVLREVARIKIRLDQEPLRSALSSGPLRVAVLTAEGHAVRVLGRNEESVARYEEALELLENTPPGEAQNRQAANLWTCRGIALQAIAKPGALEDALSSFDQAIAIRSAAPLPRSAADQWGLAAAWLNRSDTLAFLGEAPRLDEALESTRKAREALEVMEKTDAPSYRVRLALTWMKESEILTKRWGEFRLGAKEDVCEGFHRAAAILRPVAMKGDGEARRVLASILTSLSRTRLYLGDAGSSEGEAEGKEALRHVGKAENLFPEAAVLAATARLTVSLHIANSPQWPERALEVTDLVEEGLAVIAKWRKKGPGKAFNEGLIAELIRLAAEGYLVAAPQFLKDFILDQLDPDRSDDHFAELAECQEVAVKLLWKGIASIKEEGFSDSGGEEYESRRERLVAWEQCRERLAEIRPLYFEI